MVGDIFIGVWSVLAVAAGLLLMLRPKQVGKLMDDMNSGNLLNRYLPKWSSLLFVLRATGALFFAAGIVLPIFLVTGMLNTSD